jgi:phosphohistidine phosphatase SixA
VDVLRTGGVAIYFRHAATDHSQIDRKGVAADDCAGQRNLSEKGRAQARAIGESLRAIGAELEEPVLSSPYCRTMDTARLIAGGAMPSRDVLGGVDAQGKVDYSKLRALLATPPATGKVRVIVSHGNQLQDLAGPPELAEGEAAVIRGDGGGWKILMRVPAADWPRPGVTRSAPPPDAGSAPMPRESTSGPPRASAARP